MRFIARLDTKNNKVIKSVRYEGLNVIGDINKIAIDYYNQGIDELIYIDTVASLYERNSLNKTIDNATRNIFVPITVGGGIKSIEDAKKIFFYGADKIAINKAFIKKPNLIQEMKSVFGSQAIVVSVQAKKKNSNSWELFFDNGREPSGKDVIEWSKEVEARGAGEILLSSIDCDGTMKGPDIDLITKVSDAVTIPVIASSGISSYENVNEILKTNVSAIAVGASLHYKKLTIMQTKKKLNDFIKKNSNS